MCLICFLRYVGAIDTTEEFAESSVVWAGTHSGAWISSIKADNGVIYKYLLKANVSVLYYYFSLFTKKLLINS